MTTLPGRDAGSDDAEQDAAVAALRGGATAWAMIDLTERIGVLESLVATTAAVAERWAQTGCELKSIPLDTPAEGEEWLSGPYPVLRCLRQLIRTLEDVRDRGTPGLPGRARKRSDGRVSAPVFPTDPLDRILFRGVTAWTWMKRDVELATLPETMAVLYRSGEIEPRVALVLGAGNVSSIGPLDVLHKLFTEGEVVLLKMSPVNEAMGPVIEDALRPLIDRDALRVVYGGAEVGARLCVHGGIDSIHVTGSERTHDEIVWGSGDDARERKLSGTPRNNRPVTSELGNVSPVIVVPGPWSKGDLEYQGRNLASSLTTNAGFNCNATRVVITHAGWDKREALLEAVRAALRATPDRVPYYPGAEERHAAFLEAHPDAFRTGAEGVGHVPWTFIEGVDPSCTVDVCFQTEAWCGVMAETPVVTPGEAADVAEYVRKAVRIANDTLQGTLNVTLLVHPRSMRDPEVALAVERAITDLRFGTVAVNIWAAASFVLGSTPWGAYPGNTLDDVGSGIGFVHNTYLFDRVEKTVMRGPFRMFPVPLWFPSNRTGHLVARHITRLAAKVTFGRVVRTLVAAVGIGRYRNRSATSGL